jgi:hypothetical protein
MKLLHLLVNLFESYDDDDDNDYYYYYYYYYARTYEHQKCNKRLESAL